MGLDELASHMKAMLHTTNTDSQFLDTCRAYLQRAFDLGYDSGFAAEWEKASLEDLEKFYNEEDKNGKEG